MNDDCICKTAEIPLSLLEPGVAQHLKALSASQNLSGSTTLDTDLISLPIGDQVWVGETGITNLAGNSLGSVFGTRYFVGGQEWWAESWVVTDWAGFNTTPTPQILTYQGPTGDADTFIYGLKQQGFSGQIWRMDVNFQYQDFAATVPTLPTTPPPTSLTQQILQVETKTASGSTVSGFLLRETQMLASTQQLRIDQWTLFDNYIIPQTSTVQTVISQYSGTDAPSLPVSPKDFADWAAAKAGAQGQAAQYYVNTTGTFQVV